MQRELIMEGFDIPVCLFLFQRSDTVLRIIERLSEVKPKRLYLMCDQGRNEEEKKRVSLCRETVEKAINWECDVIKDYAPENRGVFGNIGLGALRVFEKEDVAIFLEDDNLPEVTFFQFCKEMLDRYKDNDRVLWVCGTNYLGKYNNESNESYMFTQSLLPCGWASWKNKFVKYYDAYFEHYNDIVVSRMRETYRCKPLFKQQLEVIDRERTRMQNGERFGSWDFQMCFSIRANDLLGISPKYNQIRNIGVDAFSEHGGHSYNNIMTKRFCGMESYPLDYPLKHPETVLIDYEYERIIDRIILYPLSWRIRKPFGKIKRKVISIIKGK
jgi:hypothetical protein